MQDVVATLTVDEIKTALAELGLVGKGAKPKLVDTLASAEPRSSATI